MIIRSYFYFDYHWFHNRFVFFSLYLLVRPLLIDLVNTMAASLIVGTIDDSTHVIGMSMGLQEIKGASYR